MDKLAEMCAATLSSLNHATHDTFVELIQTVIDITDQAGGRLDARKLGAGQRLEKRAAEG